MNDLPARAVYDNEKGEEHKVRNMLYTSAEYDNVLNSIESSAKWRFHDDGQLSKPLSIKSGKTGERISGTDAFALASLILSNVDEFGHSPSGCGIHKEPLVFAISGEPDDGIHDVTLFMSVDEHRSTRCRWYYAEDFIVFDQVDKAEYDFCSWVADTVAPKCMGQIARHSKYDGCGHLLGTVYGEEFE